MRLMVAIQGSQYLFPSYWVIVKAKLNLKNAQYILYTHNSRLNIDLHGVFFMSLAIFLFPHQCPIVTSLHKAAYNWKYFLQLKSLLLTKRKKILCDLWWFKYLALYIWQHLSEADSRICRSYSCCFRAVIGFSKELHPKEEQCTRPSMPGYPQWIGSKQHTTLTTAYLLCRFQGRKLPVKQVYIQWA